MKYLALLRGINVGGNNIIKMADLKHSLLNAGFTDVTTYIQSGNVIFESPEKDIDSLTQKIESLLSKDFNYQAQIVLLTKDQLEKIIGKIPSLWKKPDDFRCYVAFLKPPLREADAVIEFSPKENVDFVHTGPGVIYMTTISSGLTKSGFTKLIKSKIYKQLTIRNLNTTKKLTELMEHTK